LPMGVIHRQFGERGKIKAVATRSGNRTKCSYFRGRQTRRAKLTVASRLNQFHLAPGECLEEPPPDRLGAGDRQLLANDNTRQPLKPRRSPPQRYGPRSADYLAQPPVAARQIFEPFGYILFAIDDPHGQFPIALC
jgi:hypothetical protein